MNAIRPMLRPFPDPHEAVSNEVLQNLQRTYVLLYKMAWYNSPEFNVDSVHLWNSPKWLQQGIDSLTLNLARRDLLSHLVKTGDEMPDNDVLYGESPDH